MADEYATAGGRIFISGTGRAGTTFLIQLLTALGCDTGFQGHERDGVYFETARAGFEWDIFDQNGPRIIKSPYLCDRVDEVLATGIAIEHILVPVRDFAQAAASRGNVQWATTGCRRGATVAGGLWGTSDAANQQQVLEAKFAQLIVAAARNDIPVTFLWFPRLVLDSDYLYGKLSHVLGPIRRDEFAAAFAAVSQPDLIHNFTSA